METHFPLARISTLTLGGSRPNSPVLDPPTWTEKNRVESFFEPVDRTHFIPVGGPERAWAVGVITTTGMITSCGERPPWK